MPVDPSTQGSYLDRDTVEAADANQSANTGDEAAGSPAADKDEGPKSILEAVQAAVETTEAQEQPSGSEGKDKAKGAEGGADAAGDEAKAKGPDAKEGDKDPFDDPSLPFHKHPRWQELRGQLKTTAAEREQFKQGHDAFVALTSFVDNAGLSRDEVNEGFEIMRLMKNEPQTAIPKLEKLLKDLRTFVGDADAIDIPDDLKEKIENGYVDEATARELALMRARSHQTEQASQNARVEAFNAMRRDTIIAVDAWEKRQRSSDPDYEKKSRRVTERFELALHKANGFLPKDKAISLLDQIAREVGEEYASVMPPKREIKRPIGGDGNPGGAAPTPKSMLEVVQQASRAA